MLQPRSVSTTILTCALVVACTKPTPPADRSAEVEPDAPADVEFGFQDGELRLFQIRPFLDNAAARGNQYLVDMDPAPASLATVTVDLGGIPQ